MVVAYARSTSVAAGGRLSFRIRDERGGPAGPAHVTVTDDVSGQIVHDADLPADTAGTPDADWTLGIPADWRSSLYRAAFTPGEGEDSEAWFAVRAATPGTRPILVSVPFTTWQAYNRFGVPAEGLYPHESPARAARVSFDRPGGGPPPERWEEGLQRWLLREGIEADYCSCVDLHDGTAQLERYRLLIVNGHDEYWTVERRDAVEAFTRGGGNVAFFGANTAWWQMRFEDGTRTMVCHRDPITDPLAAADRARTTVEWSSAPVNRPENTLTGVSFGRGAGAWGPAMHRMYEDSFTVRFADHWVFASTGLADGDLFGRGAMGYETDAAEFEEPHGVPRVTGRDGTPAGFVILATADLAHWSGYGQGGAATLGIFDSGLGTVFNAATVNWGGALQDPTVARITRTVVDRLSRPVDRRRWSVIGPAEDISALTVCSGQLYGVTGDGRLLTRELCAQNVPWLGIGRADGVLALAAPRDAEPGGPRGLYAATDDGRLRYREAAADKESWRDADILPETPLGLVICDNTLILAGRSGTLWSAPLAAEPGARRPWTPTRGAPHHTGLRTLAATHGRLFAIDATDRILTWRATAASRAADGAASARWLDHGAAGGHTVLGAGAGRLIAAGTADTADTGETADTADVAATAGGGAGSGLLSWREA